MRIDKFLKVSRLIKRREIAKELCDASAVMLNGRKAKPASEIVPGDILELALGRHHIKARILEVKPYANKETAFSMYEVLEDRVEERNDDVGF